MHVTTEVCRHAEAPWAPDLPGASWAWRVVGLGDNAISGATIGPRREAARKAEMTAKRLRGLQSCGLASKEFRINTPAPSEVPA